MVRKYALIEPVILIGYSSFLDIISKLRFFFEQMKFESCEK